MGRDFSKMSPQQMEEMYQANFGGGNQTQQPMAPKEDNTIAGLLGKISPLLRNTLVGGMQGATQDVKQDSALEQAIKYNQYQTGTPEFKTKEAQTRADMSLQSLLDADEARHQLNLNRAQQAGYVSGTTPPAQPVQPQQNIPGSPGGYEVGNPQQVNTGYVPNQDGPQTGQATSSIGQPRYIKVPKSPASQKYDASIGAMVNVPAEYGYEVDPSYKSDLENDAAKTKEFGKIEVRRSEFGQTVDNFRSLSDNMPRKYGVDRFKQGAKNIYSRTMQEENDPLASISSAYEGAKNNLTVAVARLKDVGNLSKPEQDAAAALVPQDMDSPQVYETKMAYLDALAGATTPEEIKSLINGWATGQPPPNTGVTPNLGQPNQQNDPGGFLA